MPRPKSENTWRGGYIDSRGIYYIDGRRRGWCGFRVSTGKKREKEADLILDRYILDPERVSKELREGTVGGRTEAAVRHPLDEAMKQYLVWLKAKTGHKHVKLTGEYLALWIEFLAQPPKDAAGRPYAPAAKSISDLTQEHGMGFIRWRQEAGHRRIYGPRGAVANSTVNRCVMAMRGLLTWGREEIDPPLWPGFNPFAKVPMLSEHHQQQPHRWVDHKDILAAIECLPSKWADCCIVLYGTAFRYGSFVRLSRADGCLVQTMHGRVARDPTPKGFRAVEVPISDRVFDAALRCRGQRYPDDEAQQLSRRLNLACARAGVPRWTAHDLRVSAASYMHHIKGVPLRTLQIWLGHASISTTERYVRADTHFKEVAGPL